MTGIAPEEQKPRTQMLIFSGITAGIMGAGFALSYGIIKLLYGGGVITNAGELNLSDPNIASALWIMQIISATIPFLAAPYIFAKYVVKNTGDYLRPSFKFPWFLIFVVFCVMLVSAPLIEAFTNINQKLLQPGFLVKAAWWQHVFKFLKDTEQNADQVTAILFQMKSVGSMFLKLILIGLATAIVEELTFRGVIQTILLKWTNNKHAAVWITAAVFSAFHLEFFGFLPRLMLAALFGYFVIWSGSIWPAVWGHFINNGTVVVVTYLFQNQMIDINPDDTHIFNWKVYILSLVIMLLLLYLCYSIATGKKKMRFK